MRWWLLLLLSGIVVHAEVERTLLRGLLVKTTKLIIAAVHRLLLLPHVIATLTVAAHTHGLLLLLLIATWLLGSTELPILLLLHWLLSELVERIATAHLIGHLSLELIVLIVLLLLLHVLLVWLLAHK